MYDKKEKPVMYKGLSLEEVKKLPCVRVPDYVPEDAAKFFEIRSEFSETDGKTITKTYWPYYDLSGKLVAYQGRNWEIPKSSKGHFFIVGEAKASNIQFFGQHKFNKGSYRKVIVLEGPSNLGVAWYTIEKYLGSKSQSYAIVSLPLGCANAKPVTSANEKWLKGAEEIILAFDNDERLPHEPKNVIRGKEATEDVYSVLLSNKVKTVDWPSHINDARDYATECLKKKKEKDFYDLVMYGAKKATSDKIIHPHEIDFEELEKPIEKGVYVEEFPKLMEKMRGIRKNELTMFTAPSGAGKSTIVSSIMGGLAEKGEKVGVIFLEEDKMDTLKRMQAYKMKKPFDELFFDPQNTGTKEERLEAWKWVSEQNEDGSSKRFVLLNHFGSIMTQDLMDKIKQLVFIEKCSYLFIDHISIAISGNDSDNERKDVDILLTNLASFVVSNPVGIVAVSHINRQGSTNAGPKKGKEEDPYWVEVKKEHLRGSSAIEGLCWNIVGVEPEIMPDRSRGRVRLTLLKNRKAMKLGVADVLRMSPETGRMEDASDVDEAKF